jgi:hypothetical protein
MVDPGAVGSLWQSAVQHAAMVYKRLLDADNRDAATDLDRHFTYWFAQQYEDEMVRVFRDDTGVATEPSDDGADDDG